MTQKQEDEFRLRKAKEDIARCEQEEMQARSKLNECTASTKRAREKYEDLFGKAEAREVARQKAARFHL